MDRAQLHFIDSQVTSIEVSIHEALELAYRFVVRDFPQVDPVRIANWAEALAVPLQLREIGIDDLERYAYAALKGKVRDWLRTGGAQERLLGVGVELERKGGTTGSFQRGVDTKILFEQLKATLGERDGYILALLLEDKSALEIATELGTAYPATRKAIQRLRERLAKTLRGEREKHKSAHGPALCCGEGVGS